MKLAATILEALEAFVMVEGMDSRSSCGKDLDPPRIRHKCQGKRKQGREDNYEAQPELVRAYNEENHNR